MGLKPGLNNVAFATQTSNQMVSARVFLWESKEKIIVTDIDGTITRYGICRDAETQRRNICFPD
jgi:phosphatidate phosphatase PAH1